MPFRMRASDLGELHALLLMYEQVYGGVDVKLLSEVAGNYWDAATYGHPPEAGRPVPPVTNPRTAGRKRRDIPGERDTILRMRNDGMTIRAIAASTGCSVGYVHKLIHEHGRDRCQK